MRRVLLAIALPFALLCACADDGPWSPDEPEEFDHRMFRSTALAGYEMPERAYVMGHAIGVYLMGKTLPRYTSRSRYFYRPGLSAPHAVVPYRWSDIVIPPSGGLDGRGGDDVGDATGGDDVDGEGEGDGDGDGSGGDDVGDPGTPPGGGTPYPPGGGTPYPPGGGTPYPPGGGDPSPPDGGDDPWIDEDCETFLNPAAIDARTLASRVDAPRVLGPDFAGPNLEAYVKEFQRGLRHALRVQDFGENVRWSEVEYLKDDVQDKGLCDYSPIILDLDGDGIEAGAPQDGVRFDLHGAGQKVRTAWPSGDDALLVLDRDGDGRITHGGELFGNARHANGFEALAELDGPRWGGNGDGVIDARDAAWHALRLWRDVDRDGVSQPVELEPLAAKNVTSLALAYETRDARDAAGNALRETGTFTRVVDGVCTTGVMIDVWFRVRAF